MNAPYPQYRSPSTGRRGIPPLGLVGSAVLALSSVLPWLRHTTISRANAFRISAGFLFSERSGDRGLRLGFVVLALGLLAFVLFLTGLPAGRILGRILGATGIVVAGLYFVQFARLWSDLRGTGPISYLGVGVYLSALGGVVALIGGPFAGRKR